MCQLHRPKTPPLRRRSRWSRFVPLWCIILMSVAYAGRGEALPLAPEPERVSPSLPLGNLGIQYQQMRDHFDRATQALEQGDYALARRLFHDTAQRGHRDAQFSLALMFDQGYGGAPDPARAAVWYTAAAEQGHPLAQHNLGVAYSHGEGVAMNIEQALRWWRAAARGGNVDSAYNLGVVYALGIHGIRRDTVKAEYWWRIAAQAGNPMAQYQLGSLYVSRNYLAAEKDRLCEAGRWWKKSAANGIQKAASALDALRENHDVSRCWRGEAVRRTHSEVP